MTQNKLFTYPLDILESPSGIQLVRGANRFVITNERASTIVKLIIALSNKGIYLEDLLSEFSEPDKNLVSSLLEALVDRRLAYYAEQATSIYGEESPQDIFIWHFNKTPSDFQTEINQAEILLAGVNLLSLNVYDCLIRSGFSNITFIDDPLLRNIRLFDDLGNVKDMPDLGALIISETDIEEKFDKQKTLLMPCSDFGGKSAFRVWNRKAFDHNIRMLPVIMHDLRGLIGPYIIPNSSPCYECLISRENANLSDIQEENIFSENAHRVQLTSSSYTDAMLQALAGMAVMEVIKIFTSIMLCPTSELIDISLLEPSLKRHPVLKIPRCECCSPAEWRPDVTINRNEFKNKLYASK